MSMHAFIISPEETVYDLISKIPSKYSVLLLDMECEYAYAHRSIRVLNVLPELFYSALSESIPEDIIICNRIHSHNVSNAEVQKRLNYLQKLAYTKKTVYILTEYTRKDLSRVRSFLYISRMCSIQSVPLSLPSI